MVIVSPSPTPFVTDDELAERLKHVENGLRHLEHWVPSLLREVTEIRQLLASAPTSTARFPELEAKP
jgi:hypothetical protein